MHVIPCAADPKDKRIAHLEGKLQHLRSWMQGLQNQMQSQAEQRETVFNARRLFIGGVPQGTSDVSEACATARDQQQIFRQHRQLPSCISLQGTRLAGYLVSSSAECIAL